MRLIAWDEGTRYLLFTDEAKDLAVIYDTSRGARSGERWRERWMKSDDWVPYDADPRPVEAAA
jgi:hypothetical protein